MLSPRQKGLLMLLGTIGLAIMMFVWMFFLNRGTLIINLPVVPYTVNLGKTSNVCQVNPCRLKLYPHEYQAAFKKDGYFEEQRTISVRLFRTDQVTITFREIPVLKQNVNFQLQEIKNIKNNLSQITFFPPALDENFLKKLPENTTEIIFSPLGHLALIKSVSGTLFPDRKGEKAGLYEVNNNSFQYTTIESFLIADWDDTEKSVIYLTANKIGGRQALKRYNYDKNNTEIITYFPREVTKGRLSQSLDGEKVILLDLTDPEAGIYLIDTKGNWKKRIKIIGEITNIKLAEDPRFLLLESREPRSRNVSLLILNLENNLIFDPKIKTSLEKTVLNQEKIIFSTHQQFKKDDSSVDKNMLLEVIEEQFLKPEESEVFIEHNLLDQTDRFLFQPKEQAPIYPLRLELDEMNNLLYFSDKDSTQNKERLWYFNLD